MRLAAIFVCCFSSSLCVCSRLVLLQGAWLWMPDDENAYLPAKATTNFKRGEKVVVETDDGEVRSTSALPSQGIFVPLLTFHPPPPLLCFENSNTRCQANAQQTL